MRRRVRADWRLGLLFLMAVISVGQTEHKTAYTGTWKLNLAKSSYQAGMDPQSQILRFTNEGKTIVSGRGKNGSSYEWSFPWSNGKEVAVEGREGLMAVQEIDDCRLDLTLRKAGRTLAIVHSVISPDGKTLTGKVRNVDEPGVKEHLELYDRQ